MQTKSLSFILALFLLALFMMPSRAQTPGGANRISLSLTHLSDFEFEVKIANISKEPVHVVRPLSYFAASSLYFILEDSSGAQMLFTYKDNAPASLETRTRNGIFDTITIQPGKAFVTKVNLHYESWWWPRSFSLDYPLKIRACYNFPRTTSGYLWSGRIVSSLILWNLPREHYKAELLHLYDSFDDSWEVR